MSQKKRMKLCGSCDGMIDLDVIICPYCGNDVSEVEESFSPKERLQDQGRKKLSVDETLSSLYPPPYQPMVTPTLPKEESKKKEEEEKSFFFPFLIFSFGVNLFLFGLFLILFSKNGELFLRWNTTYSFIYLVIGFPLIFIGNKLLLGCFKK